MRESVTAECRRGDHSVCEMTKGHGYLWMQRAQLTAEALATAEAALAAERARADAAEQALREMRSLVDLLPVKPEALERWDAILQAADQRGGEVGKGQATALLTVLEEVCAWQAETFPSRTASSIAAHLLEEADELSKSPTDGEEMADVAMLLFGLVRFTGVDLSAEIAAKLAKNRLRDFSGPPNGKGYVKARPAPATPAPEAGGAAAAETGG